MPVFIDQTGHTIHLSSLPRRIVSLVPSQTELLHSLGMENEVTGITKFCIHPDEWFRNKPRIGGTRQLNIAAIHQLKPDLIIANKEENVKEEVEELARHYPVWTSDITSLHSACEMIEQVGTIIGKEIAAREMTKLIRDRFSRIPPPAQRLPTAYFMWKNPYMAAGGNTFIHAMLEAAGFDNIFQSRPRYPEIRIEELKMSGCRLLLLSSEPFPFREKHRQELEKLLPGIKIMLADGEMFSWYGSRLLHAPDYFEKIMQQICME